MSIKDVELRFVERAVPAPEHGPDVGKIVRILQSRKLIEEHDSDRGIWPSWTDWQDVPFVGEDGKAA